MNSRDIIIIGAGPNGLVTAFYLARAGFKPLVLERRSVVGGAAVTEEFHPGFRASVLDGAAGPLVPAVAKDMQLERHGVQWLEPKCRVFAPSRDARALLLHSSAAESAKRIAPFSQADAAKYVELAKIFADAQKFISSLLTIPPPDIDHPTSSDIWNLLGAGRVFRKLGKRDMRRFLRWGPMAVADFVAEFFEMELLRAVIAARGIFGTAAGPWSAGTTALLLLRVAAGGLPDGGPIYARGGMGALSEATAAAATQAGAEIRTSAEVERILVKDGAVTGVVLNGGEEIPANAVVSAADPKRTFLKLIEPVHLAPSFLGQMQHYRCQGTVARVFFALDALPNFPALKNERDENAALTGRIHIGPDIDYLERAFDDSKYGDFSRAPFLEAAIPSLLDPSLAPNGKHVMSVHMQYAPYEVNASSAASREASPACHSEPARFSRSEASAFRSAASDSLSGGRSFSSDISNGRSSGALTPEVAASGNWPAQRDALADVVVKTLAQYAPDLPQKILARRVITPLDFEETYGLTGGHISHGELALDQLFTMRPLIGWARYRTPIRGLFLCGPGTHPGTGLTAASALNASRQILRALRR
ncbi:MAG TPA: NAD(P)/FAD-dependent oxidoreductase [Candidatus Acidoferrales bacterium]|nr:NAD(P)/FAD-dependent oxidoreductase [Candidatus Acidoferrales bacterium]